MNEFKERKTGRGDIFPPYRMEANLQTGPDETIPFVGGFVRQTNLFIRLAAFFIGVLLATCAARRWPGDRASGREDRRNRTDIHPAQPAQHPQRTCPAAKSSKRSNGADYDLAIARTKRMCRRATARQAARGFVYLGYKDTVELPVMGAGVGQAHLIFITPECHHGEQYPNQSRFGR